MLFALFAIDLHNVVVAIPAMILVLGIMILVHEFGHYAVAKLLGVRVEVFSIGFGKRLFGFKRGDTDYRVAAIPLGGYVKMSGENPMDQRSGDKAEFMSHPRWHRFLIAIAGPFMNIVLAVVIMTGVFMFHYEHEWYMYKPADIAWVAKGSAAEKAGIEAGDRIVRVDGTQNPTWEDVMLTIFLSPNQPVSLGVLRNNQVLEKTLVPVPAGREKIGSAGWVPYAPNFVTDLVPDMPAEKAGLRLGDLIVSINGTPVRSATQYIREHGDSPLNIVVDRNGQTLSFNVIPVQTQLPGDKSPVMRIGITSNPIQVDRLPFSKALPRAVEFSKKNSLLIIELVEKMIQQKVSVKQFSGPIEIARMSGEAASQPGWTPLLGFMAAISLNLGVFNLFPIPILDGGVIMFLIIEGVMRRDISLRVKERIYQAAFVFLVLFTAIIIFNDIAKNIAS